MAKLKLDLHDIFSDGVSIERALRDIMDEAVRRNRLALLSGLYNQVSAIADFSEIVTSSTTE